MEQIVKAYIGLFFVLLTVALGTSLIYSAISSRNINNEANDFVAKMRNANLAPGVIAECEKEAENVENINNLKVDIISEKDNKKSAVMTLTYDFVIPMLGIVTEKEIVRYV